MLNGFTNIPQSTWQAPVATATLLPTNGNVNGDVRVTLDTDDIYIWNGSAWVLASGGGGSGVASLNSLTGSLTLVAGSNITITPSGSNITIAASSGSSYTFADSLVNTAGTVALVNDSATPGASKYYGTNAASTLGYYAIPVSGINQLTGDVTAGPGTGSQAASLVATSNSTLTTLSALSLPYSQITGAPSAGVSALAAVGASPNANAATISGTTLNLQPFSSAQPGVVLASGGGSTNFLRADGTWAAPAGTGGITALTGDGTATGPGSVAFTLATVNTNTGSFGSSTSIPSFTVNGKGLITAASSNVVIAPAGTLSGTTLNSAVVSSSLTSVGTIATGVWNGTAVTPGFGGTGLTTLTAYAVLTGGTTSTGTLQQVSGVGTTGQVLTSNGASALPTWQAAGGSGTVTSVGLADNTGIFDITNTPVTTAGTLTMAGLLNQPANTVLAGPATGTVSTTTFTSGASNFTVPAGYALTQIEIWGAGGGGGGTNGGGAGSGGGGGGYSKLVQFQPTGTVIAYSVGAAGSGGVGNSYGNAGGNTTISTYSLTANGGNGGIPTGGGAVTGGTASGGTTNTTGSSSTAGSGSTGGNGGAGANGGAGGTGTTTGGAAGSAPGGGGAGSGTGGTQNGGAGAAGQIIFSYVSITAFRALVSADIPPINLASSANGGVTGILPVANGGTSFGTYTTGDILYASTTNVLSKLAIGSTGQALTVVSGVPAWGSNGVTSVALSLPSFITVTGSPVTTTGTLTGTLATQTANTVFAGPASGSAAAPTFRVLNIADMTIATQAISASAIDWSTGNVFTKTLGANTTFTWSNQLSGQTIVVRLTNTASNYTVTWPTVKWPGGSAPVMTTGAKSDVYTFVYDGSNTYGSAVQNF